MTTVLPLLSLLGRDTEPFPGQGNHTATGFWGKHPWIGKTASYSGESLLASICKERARKGRTNPMQVNIRPARADDSAFLAWVILASGRAHVKRGIWEVILGEPEERCLAFLQLLSATSVRHQFHCSCYLLAEVEGRAVSGLGGYDPAVLKSGAIRSAVEEVIAQLGIPPLQAMTSKDSARILDCIPAEAEGAWMIDSVATIPEFRRQGIVDMLLDEMVTKGREQGFKLSQINIYIGNTPAQRAYEKHGFRIVDEKRDPYFEAQIGSPGMARLLRT
jgi:ribosomal protein S18 acetylase RimI-like enzyme